MGHTTPICPTSNPLTMLQVRIDSDIERVLDALIQEGGIFPVFAGRSAAHAVNELVKKSPDFINAKRQMESERHPRPGFKKK